MSDEEHLRDRASLEAYAAKEGLVVRYPGPRELFIDIDGRILLNRFHENFELLREHHPTCTAQQTPSRSGGDHFHVVVTLDRDIKDAHERIALQALLGSDPKHELLSWLEATDGDEVPTCFFELPVPTQEPIR